MCLPSTQTAWDQTEWQSAPREEPCRSRLKISELAYRFCQCKGTALPLVEEDYQLVLCLLQGQVWRSAKQLALGQTQAQNWFVSTSLRRTTEPESPRTDSACRPIVDILEQWREGFALLSRTTSGPSRQVSSARMLSSLLMWHLSIIRLETDLDLVQTVGGAMRLSQERRREKFGKLEVWAKTRSGRISVWHAIEIWSLWNEYTESDIVGEPFAAIGLFQSAVVLWAFVNTGVNDGWFSDVSHPFELTGSFVSGTGPEAWIRDGGPATFTNIALSSSQRSNLILPFRQLLSRPWLAGTVSERLAILLAFLGSSNELGS